MKRIMSDSPDRIPVSSGRRRRFWLEHGRQTVELGPGVSFMGRSASCQIVLDDAMVSRRHARLTVTDQGVTVEDHASVNGVYLNSRRIQGAENVRDGDHLQVGTQEFVLRSAERLEPEPARERPLADTLHSLPVPRDIGSRSLPAMMVESESTFSAHTLDLLGGVADKVLALGRGEEAEKVLATTLGNVLNEARAGRSIAAGSHVFDKAAQYAVRLAGATGKGKWVDYAIELFAELGRPLPAATVDDLYEILRRTSNINLAALRAYLERLRGMQDHFGPSERFVLQRLEGLERIAALR